MNAMNRCELSLTRRRRINPTVETVCQARRNPATLTRFSNRSKDGIGMTKAETGPPVAGKVPFADVRHQDRYPRIGTNLERVPRPRIVLTWKAPCSTAHNPTAALDFASEGPASMLTLTHGRFDSEG